MKWQQTIVGSPSRGQPLAVAAVLFAFGVVVGLPSLHGGFLSGDDVHLVLNHVLVNHPSLAHAFELLTIVHRDLYQPIPMLSFSLDFVTLNALGLTASTEGPAAGAWVFHLTNVLIHAVNGVLVFWLVSRLQSRAGAAVVAAVLFLVHPYAAEVVAWLNGRMMLLATTFSLAALIAADACLLRRRPWLAGLALLMLALAMASKVRVGLPILMLILPLARRQWPGRLWWIMWASGGALTAGFTALNMYATWYSEMFAGAAEEMQGSPLARTVLVLAWYFQHYLLPLNMCPWHPPDRLVLWSHPDMPLALATLAAVGVATVVSLRWTRIGALGMLWFLATVASTLPLVPARDVMAADRYVYLPNIGLFWLTAVLLAQGVTWAARRFDSRLIGPVAGAAGAAAAVGLMLYTWGVQAYYVSNLAKAQRIAEVYPEHPGVWEHLGWAHYRNGNYTAAIESVTRELELHPQRMACEAYQLIGMAQFRLGRIEDAVATLRRAIAADPDYGKSYSRLGQVFYELGRYAEAETYYRRALEIMPDYLPAIQALGHTYRKLGRPADAAHWYGEGLARNDFDPVSTTALAELEMEGGQYGQAATRFERLLSWMPENALAWTNLGVCHARLGRTAEAMRAYRRALAQDPSLTTAAVNLATLEAEAGSTLTARALLERVLSQHPTHRAALIVSHDLLAATDDLAGAAHLWANALSRDPEAADLMAWYAWTSTLAGKWEPAATAALTALRRDERQSLALASLVLVHHARGAPDAADARLDRFLQTPPVPPDAPARLRNALADIGQRDPQDPWPYCLVARLLMASGENDGARMALERFRALCPEPACQERARQLLDRLPP